MVRPIRQHDLTIENLLTKPKIKFTTTKYYSLNEETHLHGWQYGPDVMTGILSNQLGFSTSPRV